MIYINSNIFVWLSHVLKRLTASLQHYLNTTTFNSQIIQNATNEMRDTNLQKKNNWRASKFIYSRNHVLINLLYIVLCFELAIAFGFIFWAPFTLKFKAYSHITSASWLSPKMFFNSCAYCWQRSSEVS